MHCILQRRVQQAVRNVKEGQVTFFMHGNERKFQGNVLQIMQSRMTSFSCLHRNWFFG